MGAGSATTDGNWHQLLGGALADGVGDPSPKYPHYWFVIEPGADLPELCSVNSKHCMQVQNVSKLVGFHC